MEFFVAFALVTALIVPALNVEASRSTSVYSGEAASCSRTAKSSTRLLISLSVIYKQITLENKLLALCNVDLSPVRASLPVDPFPPNNFPFSHSSWISW